MNKYHCQLHDLLAFNSSMSSTSITCIAYRISVESPNAGTSIRTMSASMILGYRSRSVHMESFLPSEAFFKLTAVKRSFIASLSFGNELMISFKTGDSRPTLAGVSTSSNAAATLLNAGRRTASSWGVHWNFMFCFNDHAKLLGVISYLAILDSAQALRKIWKTS